MRYFVTALAVAVLLAPAAVADENPPPELKVTRTIRVGSEFNLPIVFSPDGKWLAVGHEKRVRFFDPVTGKEAATWDLADASPANSGHITNLLFVDPKTIAVSFAAGKMVRLYSYPNQKEVARLELGNVALHELAAAEGLVATSAQRHIRVWSGPEWGSSWKAELPAGPDKRSTGFPLALAFSPDRAELVVGTDYGFVYVYRVKDGALVRQVGPDKLPGMGARVSFSPDGRELAVVTKHQLSREPPDGVGFWDAELRGCRVRTVWSGFSTAGSPSAYRVLYSPDGKSLVVPCQDKGVRVFEVATGGLRFVARAPFTSRLTMSPDGRVLATWAKGASGLDVVLLEWRLGAEKPAPATPAAFWSDLGSSDSGSGFRAVCGLGANPGEAVKLLGEKLKPVPVPDAGSVKGWIADLGAEAFAAREAAEKELAKLGDAVEPELRAASRDGNAERRAAAFRLLKGTRPDAPERLRALRAVEVLEAANNPEARALLKSLAGGAPGAALTRDAKAALARAEAAPR